MNIIIHYPKHFFNLESAKEFISNQQTWTSSPDVSVLYLPTTAEEFRVEVCEDNISVNSVNFAR